MDKESRKQWRVWIRNPGTTDRQPIAGRPILLKALETKFANRREGKSNASHYSGLVRKGSSAPAHVDVQKKSRKSAGISTHAE